MFTTNPFAILTEFISPGLLQAYVVLMILAVAAGTLFDLVHDRKALFFLRERRRARAAATRRLGAGDVAAIAARTVLTDIAAFGEFCNLKRRISHALMFYGFVLYLATTLVLVFRYAEAAAPAVLPALWHLGALMVLAGGGWFFFSLRVDVAHEGHSPFRLSRADLFIVSLLASMLFALLFPLAAQAGGATATRLLAAGYLFFTTLLFVSVPWSKFAHMFYKPVVAFQKRVEWASGASDLPTPSQPGAEKCPPSHP